MSARAPRQLTADRAATAAAGPPETGAGGAPETGAGSAQADASRADAVRPDPAQPDPAQPDPARPAKKPLPTRVPAGRQRDRAVRAGALDAVAETAAAATTSATSAAAATAHATTAHATTAHAVTVAADPQAPTGLSARLMALARMIQIGSARGGRDGFSKKLLADAEEVLGRAGERMRLSSSHTVVVLAGGTGSGKSSLFNRLAGASFSTVGVTRPVTKEAHACIWGSFGSGALLDWLGVPARSRYSRASALDKGEDDLTGLVLLDLPDHDSVMSHAGELVDRLVSLADVMIWVLDPQKYADAAVHRRFLVPLAGHSDVLSVVLNQSDLLDAAQVDDCVADLRRLLDSEDLQDVPILVTSALTGAGLDELRKRLVEGVAARQAAVDRISADVDGVVSRFARYTGDADQAESRLPDGSVDRLAERFTAAAGVTAVSDSLRSARELRAADFVGWPVAWFVQRVTGRDPMRKVRLGMLWDDLRSVTAGPAGAQQAEIDIALTEFGDKAAAPLPRPWSQTVRTAARSRADQIPAAVGAAIGEALPAQDSVLWWWRLAGMGQGLLLGLAVVAIAWAAAIVAFGVLGAASVPSLLSDTGALPWIGAAGVMALGLGAATASMCMSAVSKTAERENAEVGADLRKRIAVVATEMVVMPVEQELSEFDRYREELRIAMREPDQSVEPGSSPE